MHYRLAAQPRCPIIAPASAPSRCSLVLPEHRQLHQPRVLLVLPLPLRQGHEVGAAAGWVVAGHARAAHGEVAPTGCGLGMAAHLFEGG